LQAYYIKRISWRSLRTEILTPFVSLYCALTALKANSPEKFSGL